MKRWDRLRGELGSAPELRTLAELGAFEDFPERIRRGLEIRDAWRNLLDTEPVQAVICADDSNPATRIALLLAAHQGLPTIGCHHGALDGRYLFKRNHADMLLAKGRMEKDYLMRVCGIPADQVEIGAPRLPANLQRRPEGGKRASIVFFSEPHEMAGGRIRGFYEDVLPRLSDLAIADRKELIVKLHPAESFAERSRLVAQMLRPEQQAVTRVIDGPLRTELLDEAWCGVTVVSTVAVECQLRGVPCFLCAWLEPWPYGYVDQFTRFEVGIRLDNADQIKQIPAILRTPRPGSSVQENCWTPIQSQRLRALLGMEQESTATTLQAGKAANHCR
jgi:hypothetical protein